MDLALDICQGIGFAVGVGMRPFLPALLVGALASANAGIDFGGTAYAFLEQPVFLAALVAAVLLLTIAQRRLTPARVEEGPLGAAVAGVSLGLGAVLFAGALAAGDQLAWPGLIGGILCAAIAQLAVRDLFRRVRVRLDERAAAALPIYAEGSGLVVAGVSVPLPPLGVVALAFMGWLLVTGRRARTSKHAGLRILR